MALAGIGVAAYGAIQLWLAARCRLGDDLDAGRLRRTAGKWAVTVSRIGIGARGVIFLVLGASLVHAIATGRAPAGAGMRASLRTILLQPGGEWLLGAVAAGLVGFGIYQFLHSRYAQL